MDPLEIWQNVVECIQIAVQNLEILDINPDDIVAIALTNQRDTTVMWHKRTGRPLYNAIGKDILLYEFSIKTLFPTKWKKKRYAEFLCIYDFSLE